MGLEQVRSTWEELGRTDPLWAVMTHPERRDGGWEPVIDEFFAHGRKEVTWIVDEMAARGLYLGDRVLDFGCGVGRLSNALAEHASTVTGVDIAASMIERAKRLNQHGERIRFLDYDGHTLPFPDAGFDSVVSLVVLQHTPPETQLAALLELRRVVRPGGVLAVQIPAQPRRPTPLAPAAFRAGLTPLSAPMSIPAGHYARLDVRVTNHGSHTWPDDQQIRLGNHWLADGRTLIRDDGRVDLPTLAPGEHTELTLQIAAPARPGDYQLELDLVQETVGWFAEHGSETARIPVTVDENEQQPPPPPPPLPGKTPDPAQATKEEHDSGDDSGIEMHGLQVALVRELFNHCDCHLVDMVEDGRAGDEWESYTYFVRRGHSR